MAPRWDGAVIILQTYKELNGFALGVKVVAMDTIKVAPIGALHRTSGAYGALQQAKQS